MASPNRARTDESLGCWLQMEGNWSGVCENKLPKNRWSIDILEEELGECSGWEELGRLTQALFAGKGQKSRNREKLIGFPSDLILSENILLFFLADVAPFHVKNITVKLDV